jgi:thiosulfate/3-mercaptopyruvate sulfurtransferase
MNPSDAPLITAQDLADLMNGGQAVRLFDASFDLANPDAGEQAWRAVTLSGAHYLHLDRDLSTTKTGLNGRHPLPSRETFALTLARLGLQPEDAVVVFDRQGGMYAARLWWMLRWIGHAQVRVLDGGLPAWTACGGSLSPGEAIRNAVVSPDEIEARTQQLLRDPLAATIDRPALRDRLGSADLTLIDARSADRFRGENETLDPVGGHIPGARNRFFKDNLQADGTFKAPDTLRQEWSAVLNQASKGSPPVMQCGSGVTACHNILALVVAGLGSATLYPGSWSEWCAHPDSPIATGAA